MWRRFTLCGGDARMRRIFKYAAEMHLCDGDSRVAEIHVCGGDAGMWWICTMWRRFTYLTEIHVCGEDSHMWRRFTYVAEIHVCGGDSHM
jgi:hypothetical protein